MRLTINLATRTYFDQGKINFVLWAAVVLLVLLLVMGIHSFVEKGKEISRLKQEQVELDNRLKMLGSKVTEKDYTALLERIDMANSLIARKTLNWLELLDHLETVVPDGVSIAGIQPDLREKKLAITGVARKYSNLRAFLENLEKSTFFPEVFLLRQTVLKVKDQQDTISFEVSTGLVLTP